MLYVFVISRLIISVKLIHILDKLTVEKVERDMLGTYSGALAAVSTSARYMVCTDDVEQLLFKGVGCCLLCDTCIRVVKYALLTGTCGTHVTAGVATDTSGKHTLPELESLLRGHLLKLFYEIESTGVCDLFAVFTHDLVVCRQLL